MARIPTLDLHGVKHYEVSNVVARFIEDWLGKNLFIDIVTGNSEQMLFEAVKVEELDVGARGGCLHQLLHARHAGGCWGG